MPQATKRSLVWVSDPPTPPTRSLNPSETQRLLFPSWKQNSWHGGFSTIYLLFVLITHSLRSPTRMSPLTWTLFQPPPPQLVASGLFNSCLVPFLHSGPLLPSYESLLPAPPPCLPCPFLLPSPTASPSSFLSTLVPVALQISGGRQCQTFQLFKQVSGWCRVPAGVALPLWCPTSLVCAHLPLNPLSPRELRGPSGTSAQLRDATAPLCCFRLLHCWKEKRLWGLMKTIRAVSQQH